MPAEPADPARPPCRESHVQDVSRPERGFPDNPADAGAAAFERMWADLEGIGRRPGTGGYRRYAWTRTVTEESWTDRTVFDSALTARVAAVLGDPPRLATGAGHDAGILAAAGVPAAMLFVRNPTGVSHAPSERADCLAGVAALAAVAADVTGPEPSP